MPIIIEKFAPLASAPGTKLRMLSSTKPENHRCLVEWEMGNVKFRARTFNREAWLLQSFIKTVYAMGERAGEARVRQTVQDALDRS